MKTSIITALLSLLVGALIAFYVAGYNPLALETKKASSSQTAAEIPQPLYWVAPMDPNFKRDKPGKSPMGMDLIPVYPQAKLGADEGHGTILISAQVENNLGVRTAIADKKALTQVVHGFGQVMFDQEQWVHIHPRVEGWIESLQVKYVGAAVKKGDLLYTLYSPELVNAQEEFLLAMRSADPALIRATTLKLKALNVSDEFIAGLNRARKIQRNVDFFAPQAGVVQSLAIKEGFFVKPDTTLMSIAAIDKVWVEIEVPAQQASLIALGGVANLLLDNFPSNTWSGTIDYIYPTVDEMTRSLRIRLRVPNADQKLRPNMYARAEILIDDDSSKLLIPRQAVIRTGFQNRVVIALGGGKFKSVAVQVGQQNNDFIEILDGVSEGEAVVISAQFLLDSESSKTSDFLRLDQEPTPNSATLESQNTLWITALISDVDTHNRRLTLSHGEIAQWQRPAMAMKVAVAEGVSMSAFRQASQQRILITQSDSGEVLIIQVEAPANAVSSGGVERKK